MDESEDASTGKGSACNSSALKQPSLGREAKRSVLHLRAEDYRVCRHSIDEPSIGAVLSYFTLIEDITST